MQNFFQIERVSAAGSITNAPTASYILANVLQFLLSIVGILGIIGLVVSGVLYVSASGDGRRIALAKRSALASVTGIIIALGALVLTGQLAAFFS